jgi:predicted lipoprotein with Yx(FWY)xxD motif
MSKQAQNGRPARASRRGAERGGRRARIYLVGLGALVVAALVAAVALAKSTSAPTLGTATNAKLGATVVVNPQGRTLYSLSSESSGRLLCKSAECLATWPPYTVSSSKVKLKAGGGVQGRLGLVRRGAGRFQVTLRGKPLYRFAGDHGRDESNGEGIAAFGGTWHAVTASGAAAKPMQPTTSTSEAAPTPYPPSAPQTTPSTPTYPNTTSTPTTPTTTTTPMTTTPTYTYPTY